MLLSWLACTHPAAVSPPVPEPAAVSPPAPDPVPVEPVAAAPPPEPAPAPAPPAKPVLQVLGDATVWRTSAHKDSSGAYLPPWDKVMVENVFGFKHRPPIGDQVRVLPIQGGFPPLDLAIRQTVAREEDGGWFEVHL